MATPSECVQFTPPAVVLLVTENSTTEQCEEECCQTYAVECRAMGQSQTTVVMPNFIEIL